MECKISARSFHPCSCRLILQADAVCQPRIVPETKALWNETNPRFSPQMDVFPLRLAPLSTAPSDHVRELLGAAATDKTNLAQAYKSGCHLSWHSFLLLHDGLPLRFSTLILRRAICQVARCANFAFSWGVRTSGQTERAEQREGIEADRERESERERTDRRRERKTRERGDERGRERERERAERGVERMEGERERERLKQNTHGRRKQKTMLAWALMWNSWERQSLTILSSI